MSTEHEEEQHPRLYDLDASCENVWIHQRSMQEIIGEKAAEGDYLDIL